MFQYYHGENPTYKQTTRKGLLVTTHTTSHILYKKYAKKMTWSCTCLACSSTRNPYQICSSSKFPHTYLKIEFKVLNGKLTLY